MQIMGYAVEFKCYSEKVLRNEVEKRELEKEYIVFLLRLFWGISLWCSG